MPPATAQRAAADYAPTSGTATIAAGQTSTTVAVALTNDALDEDDETFSFVLSNPSAGTISEATATITIQDDDEAPALSIVDAAVTEDSISVTLIVRLDAASAKPITVDFATSDGSATAGADYAAQTGTLTFAPGERAQSIRVALTPDQVIEGDEAFAVDLSNPTNATLADAQATVTLIDDDGSVELSVDDATATEGDGEVDVTLRLNAPTASPVTVDFATTFGTATAEDFAATSGTATFASGQTSTTVSVALTDDMLDEDQESFVVTLSNASTGTITDAEAAVTIVDDDEAPTLSVADASSSESDGSVTITVSLDAASGKTVTVAFATQDGSAADESDYTAQSGTLMFAPGTMQQTVEVALLDDAISEDVETFTFTLSSPTRATLSDNTTATVTVTDDEAPLTISAQPAAADESSATLTFTVDLSGAAAQPVTVDFATSDASATAAQDYIAQTGTLTFAPGQTQGTISIALLDDNTDEADETLTLTLSNASRGSVGGDPAIGTIRDDDAPPVVTLIARVASEASALSATVRLDAPSSSTVTVDFATQDGTATAGLDYVAQTGTLTFAPGDTLATFELQTIEDRLKEPTETVEVLFSNPVGATLAPGSVVLSLEDDDGPLVVTVDAVTVDEDSSSVSFAVRFNGPAGVPVNVAYSTQDGTARAGEDYRSTSGTLTFGVGDTLRLVTVDLLGDIVDEPDETFSLSLETPLFGSIGDVGSATLTDNDLPLPTEFNARIYPSPFRSGTCINVELSEATPVRVDVVDMMGRIVERADAGTLPAGRHCIPVGERLASGTFVARILTPNGSTVRTLTKTQ